MSEQMLDIAKIRIDGDTQPRMAIDQGVVAEYAGLLESGTDFPPVQVVSDGAVHWLVDGFHRYFAHRKLGRKQIKAEVTAGLQEEAQWLSLSANKAHGLRRTNNDKAKAVIKALKMRPQLSDNAISEHVGVSQPTVSKYRTSIEDARKLREGTPGAKTGGNKSYNPPTRIGRDGRKCAARPGGKATISPNAFTPIRESTRPAPMTALSMPHDPVMGARTLIELFKPDYLRALVAHLSEHLKGVAQ
jgi:hypothetical protein